MNNKPLVVGGSLLVLLLLLAAGAYIGRDHLDVLTKWLPAQQQAPIKEADLGGFLLLSLGTPDTASSSAAVFPVMLDVTANKAYTLPVTELGGKQGAAIQHSFSSDTNHAVFLGATGDTTLSIYSAKFAPTDQYAQVVEALKGAVEAAKPTATDFFREYPSITDNGAILYSSVSQAQFEAADGRVEMLPADEWSVYYLPDASSTPSLAAYGLRPKWVDAMHFAYLGSDGLYVFDFDNASSTRVWASKDELTLRDGLSLSSDGTRVVISVPEENQVQVLTIPNWYSHIITDSTVIPRVAGDAVISPDNAYVAMVTVAPTSDGTKPMPTIRYFSLASKRFIDQTTPITSQASAVYLTGWQN